MARSSAYRTVNVKGLGDTRVHAAWFPGATYINLHWFDAQGPVLEVINVHDYATGQTRTDVNVSQELTEWLKEHDSAELANYYRNTV